MSYLHKLYFFLLCLCFSSCIAPFIPEKQMALLRNTYVGSYRTRKTINIGNNAELIKSTKIKLYFITNSKTIKVYAYAPSDLREEAMGSNILYLFKDEFPNKKWNIQFFKQKLQDILIIPD